MKEGIITTSALNCYGSRILTEGGDLEQFKRNPVLLFMHRRAFDGESMPIGRIENLRIEGDALIGTPVFDTNDDFAMRIAKKWEYGFLKMFSAGIEILETSADEALLLPGQSRPTVTKWKLEEVSVVDIGGNDEALQLSHKGKTLTLSAGADNEILPLLKINQENPDEINNLKQTEMNKKLLLELGLPETATEQEAVNAVRLLKNQAENAARMELTGITALVDAAVADRRITADKKEHFINLGKSAGAESLRTTLDLMQPQIKPTDIITQSVAPQGKATYTKLSEVPEAEIAQLKENDYNEYCRLYKAEYGVEI